MQEDRAGKPRKKLKDRLRKSIGLRFGPFYAQKPQGLGLHELDKRVCVSVEKEFVLVRIAKCANSTVLRTFIEHDPQRQGLVSEGYRSKHAKNNAYPRPSRLSLLEQKRAAASYTAVVFVRNPFARLASSYLDKIVRSKSQKPLVTKRLNISEATELTFNHFLDYLEHGGLYENPHWAPQVGCIPFPPGRIDLLGYVETLEADLERIVGELLPTPWKGVQSHRGHATGSETKLADLYRDEATVRRVVELYAEDFEAFGYSTELPGLKTVR